MDYDEFKKTLKINKYALDDEVIQQPVVFAEICEQYVYSISDRDDLKDQVKTIRSVVDQNYRAQMQSAGQKFTEATVLSHVDGDPQVINMQAEYRKQCEICMRLQHMVATWEQRVKMLELLTKLYGSNYFSNDVITGEGRKTIEDRKHVERRERLHKGRVSKPKLKKGRANIHAD